MRMFQKLFMMILALLGVRMLAGALGQLGSGGPAGPGGGVPLDQFINAKGPEGERNQQMTAGVLSALPNWAQKGIGKAMQIPGVRDFAARQIEGMEGGQAFLEGVARNLPDDSPLKQCAGDMLDTLNDRAAQRQQAMPAQQNNQNNQAAPPKSPRDDIHIDVPQQAAAQLPGMKMGKPAPEVPVDLNQGPELANHAMSDNKAMSSAIPHHMRLAPDTPPPSALMAQVSQKAADSQNKARSGLAPPPPRPEEPQGPEVSHAHGLQL